MKALLLIALVPLAARAQLSATLNGAPLISGNVYSVGTIPVGTTSTALLSISNGGASCVSVLVTVGNASGFSLDESTGIIVPNSTQAQAMNVTIIFSPNSSPSPQASYNANLQITPVPDTTCTAYPPIISAFIQGYGVYVPTLAASSGCAGVNPVNFGLAQTSTTETCNLTLTNSNALPVTISAVALTGPGFVDLAGLVAQTVSPGQSIPFSINFTPPSPGLLSGALSITIAPSMQPSPYTLSFTLAGTGFSPPLPAPVLTFGPEPFASQQQRVLMMTLPSPAPIAATGYVTLSFTPSGTAATVVADDSTISFMAPGSVRTLPWSVSAGATAVLLNGQSSATFQTGTTEGAITFTVTSPQIPGSPITAQPIAIPGAPAIIEQGPTTTTANKQVIGSLVITITGADNTYSTSSMSFSFFDTNGSPIQSPPITDIASAFKTYYATVNAGGSSFVAQVTFPVVGSVADIGTVTVVITNAAGNSNPVSLTFQ